jgi:hypothetical protein
MLQDPMLIGNDKNKLKVSSSSDGGIFPKIITVFLNKCN